MEIKTAKEIYLSTFDIELKRDYTFLSDSMKKDFTELEYIGSYKRTLSRRFDDNVDAAMKAYALQFIEAAAQEVETKTEKQYTGGLDGSGNLYVDVEVIDRDSILKLKDQLK